MDEGLSARARRAARRAARYAPTASSGHATGAVQISSHRSTPTGPPVGSGGGLRARITMDHSRDSAALAATPSRSLSPRQIFHEADRAPSRVPPGGASARNQHRRVGGSYLLSLRVQSVPGPQARSQQVAASGRPSTRQSIHLPPIDSDGDTERIAELSPPGGLHDQLGPAGRVLRSGGASRGQEVPHLRGSGSCCAASLRGAPPLLRLCGSCRAMRARRVRLRGLVTSRAPARSWTWRLRQATSTLRTPSVRARRRPCTASWFPWRSSASWAAGLARLLRSMTTSTRLCKRPRARSRGSGACCPPICVPPFDLSLLLGKLVHVSSDMFSALSTWGISTNRARTFSRQPNPWPLPRQPKSTAAASEPQIDLQQLHRSICSSCSLAEGATSVRCGAPARRCPPSRSHISFLRGLGAKAGRWRLPASWL